MRFMVPMILVVVVGLSGEGRGADNKIRSVVIKAVKSERQVTVEFDDSPTKEAVSSTELSLGSVLAGNAALFSTSQSAVKGKLLTFTVSSGLLLEPRGKGGNAKVVEVPLEKGDLIEVTRETAGTYLATFASKTAGKAELDQGLRIVRVLAEVPDKAEITVSEVDGQPTKRRMAIRK